MGGHCRENKKINQSASAVYLTLYIVNILLLNTICCGDKKTHCFIIKHLESQAYN